MIVINQFQIVIFVQIMELFVQLYNSNYYFLNEDKTKCHKETDLNNQYINSSYMDILMGIGRTDFIKNTEIDIFDIFYSIGIIGVIIYFIWMIYVLKRCKLNKDTKFIYILLFIISLFSGHVLISPMVTTYIGVLGSRYLNENMD